MQDSLSCPVPIADDLRISLAHGEGARLSRRLIRQEILSAFANPFLLPLADGATLPVIDGRPVVTTDSSVVSPLFFPGGDIGKLAVCGAINDLAVCGAMPMYLSVGFILEEGLPLDVLRRVIRSMKEAAQISRVEIVTGDTKVVPRGAADQIFISTTGIGRARSGVDLGTHRIRVGDKILVSGTLGDHGLAILSARAGLDLGEGLVSDVAPVYDLVAILINAGVDIHFLRDPTRGGVAAVLQEVVEQTGLTVHVDEDSCPISAAVRGASELLGLDPMHIANEGKIVAVVAPSAAKDALTALRTHPLGAGAAIIGEVANAAAPAVLVRNRFGQVRVLDEPSGAPLPRIC